MTLHDLPLISHKINLANTLKDKTKSLSKPETEGKSVDYFYLSNTTAIKKVSWVDAWHRNSTAPLTISEEVVDSFQKLFQAAKYEVFEYGVESEFSINLTSMVRKYGDIALQILTDLIIGGKVSEEAASEGLRWIGKMRDDETYNSRRVFLERCLLKSEPARVKDGAGLGIAAMDDPESIRSVEQAIAQDIIDDLRQDLSQVLNQLRGTQAERAK